MDIDSKITTYVEENFMKSSGASSISKDESLLESGILDSAGIFELTTFLESEFSVNINDEDIVPDNFESISCLASFIKGKLG